MGFDIKFDGDTIHTFDVDPRQVRAITINPGNARVPVNFESVEVSVQLEVISPADAEFQFALNQNLSLPDEISKMETILGPDPEDAEVPVEEQSAIPTVQGDGPHPGEVTEGTAPNPGSYSDMDTKQDLSAQNEETNAANEEAGNLSDQTEDPDNSSSFAFDK